jgi:alkylation response protein AidB-like acyl-CoA dehydrogenase
MNFDLLDEQQMLRESAERFVREAYKPELRRALAANKEGFSRDNWRQYAEFGWLGISLPEEAGGLGCSFVETAILMEQFGRGLILEPYLSTVVLCGRLIERSASQAQRDSLLPALIEGRLLLALAHSEPGVRSESGRVATTARREANGYVLDGTKTLALGGPSADKLIVSARLGEDAGYALFVVDRDAQGVAAQDYALIDDSRASDVHFSSVRLPESALLCGSDAAPALLDEAIDRATLACVAEALGAMEAAMDVTNEYIKARVQFGQPIGKFQALQHRMAEMFLEAQDTRSILYRGMAYIDAEPAVRRAAVSAAKAVAGPAGRFVGGQGIQLHGGNGMTQEYQIGAYFKRLVSIEKLFGDSDRQLQNLRLE